MVIPLIRPMSVACNLACDYCFHREKDQGDFSKRMSIETIKLFLKQWLNMLPETGKFELIWHGGEPLLRGKEFYREVSDFLLENSGKRIISQCIQTNGLLINSKWINLFRKYNFKIGLSIDGPKHLHDQSRFTRTGRGSFHSVLKAFQLLRLLDKSVGVVIVVNSRNVECADEIFSFLMENNIKQVQISPCMEAGKNELFSVNQEKFAKFICRLYDLWLEVNDPDLSIGYIKDIVKFFLGGDCHNCILSDRCHDFVVLDWNGDVRPCEDLFDKEVIFGNIHKNDLSDIMASVFYKRFFSEISNKRNSTCFECDWFKICKGGCPYQWKSFDAGKTELCTSNKIIFKHIQNSIANFNKNNPT